MSKIGHNKRKPANMAYKAEQRWIKNAKRRLLRHLKRFPDDKQANTILKEQA